MNTLLDEADSLRRAMVGELRSMDAIRSRPVAAAFLAVPRHLFAPGVPLETAYAANAAVWPKHDANGVLVSTVSAAHIQAVQLEQADVWRGMRVLEVGSGGYNAALLAEMVGVEGEVTSVDIDPEILDRARACLDAAGYQRVRTVEGDAENGVATFAPYDRIVVTVRSGDIPPAWVEQLAPGGRIVVPLRLRGLTRTVALDRVVHGDTDRHDPLPLLIGDDVRLCSFVPMQGLGAHHERIVEINGLTTPDVSADAAHDEGRVRLRFDASPGTDPARLAETVAAAVREASTVLWSGVEFDRVDLLDLWLGTFLPGFVVLSADPSVVEQGLLTAATRVGAPTSITQGGFAYRTKRPMTDVPGRYETGVLAWGPAASEVAARYVETIRRWGDQVATGTLRPRIEVYPTRSAVEVDTGRGVVVDRTHTRIALLWE